MKRIAAVLILAALGLGSCSTDFNVAAPYKETMVIFGFLNPRDTVQYIRISKAFLGEGNTLQMAQQKDSVYYANVLDVKMQRFTSDGIPKETVSLTRIDTIPKDPGIFCYPYQVYYATNHPILTDGSYYKLTVRNTETNVTATAQSGVVGNILLTPLTSPANFALQYINQVEFISGDNSKVYHLSIRFHYRDIDASGHSTQKAVDWDFQDQLASEYGSNGVTVTYKYWRPTFYQTIGGLIQDDPAVVSRRIDSLYPSGTLPVEFRITVGSDDFYTFYQLTQMTTGVVQDKPTFTNVNNGLGLFTSRLIQSVYRDLDLASKDTLVSSDYTHHLHFTY